MFENFTFGAAPVNPYQFEDDVQPSPKDDSFPVPSSTSTNSYPFFDDYKPSSPLDDIINKFRQQSISYEDARDAHFRQYISPTPSLSDDSEMSSPSSTATQSMPTTPISPPHGSGALACRRLQRQLNVQLQSSNSHIRDISTLVEDMLSNNSQCSLRKPPSKTSLLSSPIACLEVDPNTQDDWNNDIEIEKARRKWLNTVVNDVDEGYGGDSWDKDEECLSLRRASTPSGIRKQSLRCRTSMESVGSGRAKVAKLPRMRTRKLKVGRVVE